jgi:hypothetical protein
LSNRIDVSFIHIKSTEPNIYSLTVNGVNSACGRISGGMITSGDTVISNIEFILPPNLALEECMREI